MTDESRIAASMAAMRRSSLLRRVHFWAALIASPFALIAVLTGFLYVFTPQIEQMRYGQLDHVVPAATQRTLDEIVAAASAAVPEGGRVQSVYPADTPDDAAKISFLLDGARQTTVYVNPYTAAVLGALPDTDRFSSWAKKLHSSLLQGSGWRWMIELAASWLLVMLLTGIYLWWPRDGGTGFPVAGTRGRSAWRQWHGFAGVLLCTLTLTMLVTGITWSKYAGAQIRQLRDYAGQAPPQAPKNLVSLMETGNEFLSWQSAWMIARKVAPGISMQIMAPVDEQGVWRVLSADRSKPFGKFEMVMDAYSGKQLYFAGWDDQPVFAKATALGIPFHRGEFGVWNQCLLILFAGGILFSLISGWMMYFKRPRGISFFLPPILPGSLRALPVSVWVVLVLLLALLPMLAISFVVVSVIEVCIYWRSSPENG